MRIAHLIMIHKNAGQVERLLQALAHDDADCYLHLDAQVDMQAYAHLATRPRVFFIQERVAARWASFRFVEAVLQGVREILATNIAYDYINLLSGQDYPIQPPAAIQQFLADHPGKAFLSFEPANSAWWQHAIARTEQYHSVYYKFPAQYTLEKLANRLLPKRRFPLPYALYGGPNGSWWTISQACAAYLVDFMDHHPAVRRFGRFSWGPDEFMVATILLNSPFKDHVINNNYRYIDWSAGGANPKVLTAADAPRLAQSSQWFARKFDDTHETRILDLLDQMLAGKSLTTQ